VLITISPSCRFDVALWVKKNIIDVERAKASAQSNGLKIAGSSGDGKQEDLISIVLTKDKDEATQRAERDKEAEAKRMQNILPAWHLKSTISGDLTALGIKENARAEEVAKDNIERLPNSNDALLRGGLKTDEQSVRIITADVKPDISRDREADCTCHFIYVCLT
jgi:transcription initiation factor TFIIE subunit alpha